MHFDSGCGCHRQLMILISHAMQLWTLILASERSPTRAKVYEVLLLYREKYGG